MQSGGDTASRSGDLDLLRRQRADLHDAYLWGSRQLRWSSERLATERERRLRELLQRAAERSPFWAERLAGVDPAGFTEADLPTLPILNRAEMMDQFDRLVTVPGLTRTRVSEFVEQADPYGYLDGRYRAIKTSGANGTEALHVYGWDAFTTFVMQGSRWSGRRGELPDTVIAQIYSCSPMHESGIFHAFIDFESGVARSHCFSGTTPIPELVQALHAASPRIDGLQGWPSVIRLLAVEAIAGRLELEPTWVSVAGEVCHPAVRDAVREAWGLEVSEFWGCSEGTYAFPCAEGSGMHLSDDLVILEPVDRDGKPVPYGQPADRVLLTNLFNLDQPLIRYDLADAMTLSDEPCPCGCAHRRITEVRARTDGTLGLAGGTAVPRRELEEALLDAAGVLEFSVEPGAMGIEISVVTDDAYDESELRRVLAGVLAGRGITDPDVRIRVISEPVRLWSGKVRQFPS